MKQTYEATITIHRNQPDTNEPWRHTCAVFPNFGLAKAYVRRMVRKPDHDCGEVTDGQGNRLFYAEASREA